MSQTTVIDNITSARLAHLEFDIKYVDTSFVNAIRRIILSEIPNVAIGFDPYHADNSDITFYKNTSSLHNEYLGHRISLLPVCLSEQEIEVYDKNTKPVVMKLQKKNTGVDIMDITTDDIVVVDPDTGASMSLDETRRLFPLHHFTKDPILITKLKPNLYSSDSGEEIDVKMVVSKNIGKTHVRWVPTSTCTYVNIVDEELAKQEFEKQIVNIPENKRDIFKNQFDNLEKQRYFYRNEYNEANQFHYTLVSECALSPKYLFTKAIKILKAKTRVFLDNDSKYIVETMSGKDEDVELQGGAGDNDTAFSNLYIVVINDEDYTMGNFLQSMMFNILHRDLKYVNFIGYFKPHPLQNEIVFKIKFAPNAPFTNIKGMFDFVIPKILDHIESIEKVWYEAIGEAVPETTTNRTDKSTEKSKIVRKKK